MFKVNRFKDALDLRDIPNEGQHDAKIVKIEGTKSSAGNDMIVIDLVIDEGPDQGHKVRTWIVWNRIGEQQFAQLLDYAGASWDDSDREFNSIGEFVNSIAWEGLRVNITLEHKYSRKTQYGYEDITKAVYETCNDTKYINARVKDYAPVKNEATLKDEKPGIFDNQKNMDTLDNSEDPDDELPF